MAETMGGNIRVVPGYMAIGLKGSGTITEGRIVCVDTTVTDEATVKLASANSMTAIGYVDVEWEDADRVTVYTGGVARLYAASTVTVGDLVGCAATGGIRPYLTTVGQSGTIIGTALESITATEFGKVLVEITPRVDGHR